MSVTPNRSVIAQYHDCDVCGDRVLEARRASRWYLCPPCRKAKRQGLL